MSEFEFIQEADFWNFTTEIFLTIPKISINLTNTNSANFKSKQPIFMTFLKNIYLLFFLLANLLSSCQPAEKTASNQEKGAFQAQNEDDFTENRHKKHRKRHKRDVNDNKNAKYASENRTNANKSDISSGNVPEKALKVLKYVRDNGVAMDGYVGGRRFGNFENLLPKNDASGKKINYQEWDVNPKTRGRNRGTERLITGSDGKGYYTNDHYRSFVEVKLQIINNQ